MDFDIQRTNIRGGNRIDTLAIELMMAMAKTDYTTDELLTAAMKLADMYNNPEE